MTAAANNTPRWVLLNKAAIRYAVSGTRGRPALLIHEMGGSLESWDPVLEFIPREQRIIRCDLRGSGGSEKIRGEITCDDLADDVLELLDHLRITEPVNVTGVAIGGCTALRFAARNPERVHRLAPINPPTDAFGRSGEVLRERAKAADAHGMRAIVESALARSYPDFLREDKERYDAYVARFLTNDPTSYAHIVRALANIDFTGVLERIRAPTLFLSGRHDLVRRSADIAAITPRVPGARFLEIDGGHMPSVQAPAALAKVLTEFFGW